MWRFSMLTTSHPDDIPWDGEVLTKPTPCSEETETGYVFQDVVWKQKVLGLGTFLPLNLIGRNQERLQVSHALAIVRRCTEMRHVLSIQVDGLYLQLPKRTFAGLKKEF